MPGMSGPASNLAAQIEAEHQAAIGAAHSAIGHAIACGDLLSDVKAGVAHGEWLPWVAANLSFGERQARKYMQLASNAEVVRIRTCGADLGINAALELIAQPEPEPEAPDPASPTDPDPEPDPEPDDEPEPEAAPTDPEPEDKPEPDPAAAFSLPLKSAYWLYIDPDQLAAECHDPGALRDLVMPHYERLRLLVNALDRRLRAGARPKAVPQPVHLVRTGWEPL
jgi:hypothetical protein